MIGVTICSPKFRALAQTAQERFEEATGLPSVLFSSPVEKNYLAKFELHTMFKGQTVVYFDADLWFIEKCDLSQFNDREGFLAVLDPGVYDTGAFPVPDCRVLGADSKQYFNSGLFIWNDRHRDVFRRGLELYRKHFRQLKDFGEQSCLNAAAQEVSKVELISEAYNFFPVLGADTLKRTGSEECPFAIHAAGINLAKKRRALEFYEAKYKKEFA